MWGAASAWLTLNMHLLEVSGCISVRRCVYLHAKDTIPHVQSCMAIRSVLFGSAQSTRMRLCTAIWRRVHTAEYASFWP